MAIFSNNNIFAFNIPDFNPTGITSVINISGVPTGAFLRQIRVSLNITHTFTNDLDIYLINPDGNQIELSTDNGDSDDNYTNTVFVDSAATAITAGVAPFTGSFRPEQALSTLYPGAINGNWSLKVVDDLDSDTGTLTNWSIDLSFGEASRSYADPIADGRSTVSASRDGRFSVSWNNGYNAGDIANEIYAADGSAVVAQLGSNLPSIAEFSAASTFLRDGRHVLAFIRGNDVNIKLDSGDTFATNVGTFMSAQIGDQVSPMVAELSNGNLIVAYVDITSNTLQGRIFNTTTNTFGAAVTLTTNGANLSSSPNPALQPAELIALSGGGFAVSYLIQNGNLNQNGNSFVRIFDNNAANGFTAHISTFSGTHGASVLVQLTNTNIMVISFDQAGGFLDVLQYTAAGVLIPGTNHFFNVLNAPGAEFHNLRAAVLLDGRVMVVGSSLVEGAVAGSDIWGQILNANGTANGAAFRINGDNLAGTQSAPDIATLADGRVVVTWTDHSTNSGDIMQQIIDLRATGVTLNGFESLNETWIGTRFIDTMNGGLGNDALTGGVGNDIINGGAGEDTAVYNHPNSFPSISVKWGGQANNLQFMLGNEGTDTLIDVEIVKLVLPNGTASTTPTVNFTQYFGVEALGINAYGTSGASGGWADNDLYTRRIGDVNGDTRADIIAFGSDFTYVSLGQAGGTFAGPTIGINSFGSGAAGGSWVSDNVYKRQIADVNGDGRDDIVGFGSDFTYVSLSQGIGTFAAPIIGINSFGASVPAGGWTNNDLYARELADVNGDSRADIIGFGSDFTFVALGQMNGTFANPFIAIAGFGASAAGGGWTSNNQFPRFVGDISGDGRADIVGFGGAGVYVSLGQADGTFAATTLGTTQFSQNSGWSSQTALPRMLGDLNGDGRMDLIGFGSAGTYGALALPGGTGFTQAALMTASFGAGPADGLWDSNLINPRMVGDIDADGRADLIGFGTTGAITAINSTDFFVI